jgi:glycosyltransferase involved in cell wall biosynthesis
MVSVICPIYNEEKYIAQCIESVLAQDYPKEDLEVLENNFNKMLDKF